MKKQDQALFNLIKSFSPNEKGQFIKYAASLPGIKGVRYMELFRIIAELKEYDEQKLEAKLAKINFPPHAHRIRHYLYGLLLDFLEKYHQPLTENEQHLKLLLQASILSSRKLYSHSNSLLSKIEKTASGTGKHTIKIAALKVRVANSQGLEQNHFIPAILDEINQQAMLNYWLSEINKLNTFLYAAYEQSGTAKTKEEATTYTALYNRVNSLIDTQKMDALALLVFYNLRFIYGVMINSKKTSQQALDAGYQLILTLSDLYAANKQIITFFSEDYMNYFLKIKAFKKVKNKLSELDEWLNKKTFSTEEQDTLKHIIYLQKFDLLLADHTLQNDTDFISSLFHWFAQNKLLAVYQNHYHFNRAIWHLYLDEPKEILKHINPLLNDREHKIQHPLQNMELEFINIITHCKLAHLDLVESLVTSLRRKLAHLPNALPALPYTTFAKLMVKHFSAYPLLNLPAGQSEWENKLLTDMKNYFKKPSAKIETLGFDYVWYFENVF